MRRLALNDVYHNCESRRLETSDEDRRIRNMMTENSKIFLQRRFENHANHDLQPPST